VIGLRDLRFRLFSTPYIHGLYLLAGLQVVPDLSHRADPFPFLVYASRHVANLMFRLLFPMLFRVDGHARRRFCASSVHPALSTAATISIRTTVHDVRESISPKYRMKTKCYCSMFDYASDGSAHSCCQSCMEHIIRHGCMWLAWSPV
jgi:hypothetical protein